jgi:hypothetical protein
MCSRSRPGYIVGSMALSSQAASDDPDLTLDQIKSEALAKDGCRARKGCERY